MQVDAVVFDLDGTLLDSDEALAAPFVELGVPREAVTFGHVVAEECARLGIAVDDYLERYDVAAAPPFPGVDELVRTLEARGVRWAVCSNKIRRYGVAELERLGWAPEVALFADDFERGLGKSLGPVLAALDVAAGPGVVFVGDTDHDRACAREVGARFVWAGWNRRAAADPVRDGELVLAAPSDLLGVLG